MQRDDIDTLLTFLNTTLVAVSSGINALHIAEAIGDLVLTMHRDNRVKATPAEWQKIIGMADESDADLADALRDA